MITLHMICGDSYCSPIVFGPESNNRKTPLVCFRGIPRCFCFANMNIWKEINSYVRYTKHCNENITLLKDNIVLN